MSLHSIAVIVVHLALAGIGAWLIVIDARTHRLPNRIVLPTLGALVLLAIIEALATGDGERLVRALLGGLALGAFYAVMHLISRQGMGGGDVKLAAVIGLVLAWHGWQVLVLGAAAAFLLGALYAIVLMLLRRANRHTRIAFGPWMIIGAVLAIGLA
ncbi:prepilin peptidase [Microbacterium esteraromaticum]|uniref:Prepilin peptidase n=1 Tax=Microbacterium esteraromaticum TaxID=57043 RepID=A0A939DX34_9MICO|nr:A24 family peptidase [Microbacterium esteraromaticum]MBN8206491.1 prepilin peptidase [Microbacterium esteraromaticum]MBN8416646.1 prepilin peptidase [Microbacterium esteraromaticum]MBN8422955.1 prepilin peptidase [Microbacterium esteraromaticum]WDH77776.1 A24 family peptidase [Microbacterium esteraromaticum]